MKTRSIAQSACVPYSNRSNFPVLHQKDQHKQSIYSGLGLTERLKKTA